MFVSGEHNPMKTFFNFRKPQGTNLIDRWGKKPTIQPMIDSLSIKIDKKISFNELHTLNLHLHFQCD
jgi:hypothetical protein